MAKPWFGPKTYGYGLTPISPAGWWATAAYAAAMVATPIIAKTLAAPPWAIAAAIAVLTAGFLALALLKGDGQPMRWRWGPGA